jgi:hypothetical protein
MDNFGFWRKLAVLAAWCVAACGCGSSKTVIEGQITLDGKPLSSGVIAFEPTERGGKAFDSDITDGKYRIEMPRDDVTGKCVVRITSLQATGRKIPAGPPAPQGTLISEMAEAIPQQYNAKSTLQVNLASSGPHDFSLSTSPK